MIGRLRESKELQDVIDSGRSEFVVVYGRRRVGKTYLIRNYFNNQFTFYSTGLANDELAVQLANFNTALKLHKAYKQTEDATNWMEAFTNLTKILAASKAPIKTIFIDELPWMDTKNSDLITAIDFFWNKWASARSDIKFIVCGSSASWMLNKLLKNTKGLYNRITNKIKLQPFTLSETKAYLQKLHCKYDNYQVVQLYMALGGIPYYLNYIKPTESAAQNINRLFFSEAAKLKDEYDQLFASMFKNYKQHLNVVNTLAVKKKGLYKNEIVKYAKISDGGTLSNTLKELEASDFIKKYNTPGKILRNARYQLTDNFTLFYNNFLYKTTDHNYWLNAINTPQYYAWAGNAFEIVCLQHETQIKKALGISGIQTNTYTWGNDKAQVDLVLDRNDNVINLVEIKFSIHEFTISKEYEKKLQQKIAAYMLAHPSKKAVWLVMLTTYSLATVRNAALVHNSLTMDVLFE